MLNTVELKRQRTALKLERKTLAEAVRERDLTDEEQSKFDDLSNKVDALDKRIETLEKVENDDEPDDEEDDQEEMDDDQEEMDDEPCRTKKPGKGKKRNHLPDFPHISC
jgi:hypothetical protein